MRELYSERLAARQSSAAALRGRERNISIVRLLLIAATIALAFWSVYASLVPLAIFVALVVAHERLIRARKRAERGAAFYTLGLARVDDEWQGKGDGGEEFVEEHHPYAGDFDLFGKGSLFELISIAVTKAGRTRLARWLKEPSLDAAEIRSRQAAMLELRERIDLREDLAIAASEVTRDVESAHLDAWAALPPVRITPLERVAAIVLPAAAIVLFALTLPSWVTRVIGLTHPEAELQIGFLANMPSLPLLIVLIAAGFLARHLHPRVEPIVTAVERAEPALALLAGVLQRLERESFSSERLIALHDRLRGADGAASAEIEKLRRLVALLDARRNQFFALFAIVLLWTTHVALAIDRWRTRSGARIGDWIEAVGEIEALASLGSFAFEHPEFAVPEVVDRASGVGLQASGAVDGASGVGLQASGASGEQDSVSLKTPGAAGEEPQTPDARRPTPPLYDARRPTPPLYDARALGHPLIPTGRRITNDIRLDDTLRLLVVSGSNMSGKSTMMRSVGVAAVLAMSGGVVCAKSLRIAPTSVGASIRIHDSLHENASRFYAEILRIRQVLEMSRSGPLLYLLDEILAGTNSHDRRIGAEAIVRGLVERGSIGLVSTHDLALAQIADSLGARAANVHFEDHIEDGKVVFDYRMRPGVVTKSNALELMRSVGIEV